MQGLLEDIRVARPRLDGLREAPEQLPVLGASPEPPFDEVPVSAALEDVKEDDQRDCGADDDPGKSGKKQVHGQPSK